MQSFLVTLCNLPEATFQFGVEYVCLAPVHQLKIPPVKQILHTCIVYPVISFTGKAISNLSFPMHVIGLIMIDKPNIKKDAAMIMPER